MGSRLLSGLVMRLAGRNAGCSVLGDDCVDTAVEGTSGPQARWYRVLFEADCGTWRVVVGQMVTRASMIISGGFPGQTFTSFDTAPNSIAFLRAGLPFLPSGFKPAL